MPWKYTEEYYREYTRTTWNESAPAYARLLERMEPFTADLIAGMHLQPGEAVLDLGTGPGEPALTIAPLLGPGGRVTGVDLSEKMIELAQERAAAKGITNATFRAMDCSTLEFPDHSFDAGVSRFGFQIFTDPERAAKEAFRVLRPGGRIAVTVWGRGPQVPALDVLVAPMLEHAEPDETGYIPTPYETGGPGEMVRFLNAAGFSGGAERRVNHPWTFRSEEEYLSAVLTGTPLGHSLSEESPEVQEEVLRKTRQNLQRYRSNGGFVLPAEAAVVTAHRPG
jgi:SAM-dependent methyltransferase